MTALREGPRPPAAAELSSRKRMTATLGVILALALTSIDVSVVSTAMPHIVGELHGLAVYAWAGVTYAVAAAVVVPIAGKLGDMFGRKPFLLVGLVGFMASSWACGAAQTMTQLIVLRGLQGLFAGIQMANIFTVVADIFTAERRIQIQGVLFSVAGLSMVIGPPLGGYITDSIGWRWVFYINVPIVLVTVFAVLTAVPFVRSSARWRDIDFAGVATLVAGLAPILVGLSLAGDGHAWSSVAVIGPIAGGAVMLGAFVYTELRVAAHPIVPFDLFKSNQFAVMVAVAFFSAFAMMGTLFYVPLLYQSVLGISATFSGSLLIPLTLALMVVPPIAGKALSSMPRYRYLGTLAFAAMVGGLLLLTGVDPGSGRGVTVLAMVLVGLGIGIAFPMATSVVQSAVPMKLLGAATSQVQFWRMIAGPVAIAVLGTLMSGKTGAAASPRQLASALHEVFLVAGLTVALGLVATLFLKEVPLRKMPGMARRKKKSATPVSETV